MTTLPEIVADYIHRVQEDAEEEQRWFSALCDLNEAVSRAALAVTPDGKRLSHQRRIPRSVLAESRSQLLLSSKKLARATSFEELHEIIAGVIGSIEGIGELTVYDTALRIGAKLQLEPNVVFLHAGTRTGASRLGLNVSRPSIPLAEFPPPLQKLKPREVEDVLCIYKDQLGVSATPNLPGKGCYDAANPAIHRTCAKNRAGR